MKRDGPGRPTTRRTIPGRHCTSNAPSSVAFISFPVTTKPRSRAGLPLESKPYRVYRPGSDPDGLRQPRQQHAKPQQLGNDLFGDRGRGLAKLTGQLHAARRSHRMAFCMASGGTAYSRAKSSMSSPASNLSASTAVRTPSRSKTGRPNDSRGSITTSALCALRAGAGKRTIFSGTPFGSRRTRCNRFRIISRSWS